MSIFRDFFVKEKPFFTGIARGFGFGGGVRTSSGTATWNTTMVEYMTLGRHTFLLVLLRTVVLLEISVAGCILKYLFKVIIKPGTYRQDLKLVGGGGGR